MIKLNAIRRRQIKVRNINANGFNRLISASVIDVRRHAWPKRNINAWCKNNGYSYEQY